MSTLQKYYYLRVTFEGGKTRVRPLPGQMIVEMSSTGTGIAKPVDSNKNVSCDKSFRTKVPVNSIVATDKLTLASGGLHYVAAMIILMEKPLDKTLEDYQVAEWEVLADFEKVFKIPYNEYKRVGVDSVLTEETPVTPPARKRSFMDRLKNNKQYDPPTVAEDGFHIDSEKWYFTVRAVLQEEPLLLVGPTGCGKTELLTYVAKAVERPSHFIDMGGMLDGVSGLIGVHRIKDGDSKFDFAKFAEVIQKPSIVVLDELNRAPITTNNIIFPCLDFRKSLPASVAGSEDLRDIPLHEDCYIAATANLGAQYTGTASLDRALQDRFSLFELDYLEEDIEVSVLTARTSILASTARRVVGIMNAIRESYKVGELSTAVSTRHGIRVARYLYDGLEPLDAMSFGFLPLFEGTVSEGERSVVYNLILGK